MGAIQISPHEVSKKLNSESLNVRERTVEHLYIGISKSHLIGCIGLVMIHCFGVL